MPETGSTEESAVAEREKTTTSHDMTALVGSLSAFAADTGRADLAKRLEHTRARLLDPDVRVIVVGEFKQGKSKLINALVNAPACPVDDDIATSVPTSVGYARGGVGVDPRARRGRRADARGPARRAPRSAHRRALRLRVGAGQPRQRAAHPLRGGAPAPRDPQGRTQARRLARGRRPGFVQCARDAVRAVVGPRRAARLGCVAGVHRAGGAVPQARDADLAQRRRRAGQDRPLPGVAPDRAARPRPPSRGGRCADVLGLERPAAARRRAAGSRAQRRVRLPGARRAPAPRSARTRRAHPRAQRGARPRLGRRTAHGLAALRAERDAAPRGHSAHDRRARGGESARRRVPRALRALAGDAHRRHRRPHRRHGARPARSAAQGAARSGELDRRGRPRPDLGPDHRVARPACRRSGLGDLRLDRRALALAVRRGRPAVQRGGVRAAGDRRRRHRRASWIRSSTSPASIRGGWVRARRSTSACAARTAACSWWASPRGSSA